MLLRLFRTSIRIAPFILIACACSTGPEPTGEQGWEPIATAFGEADADRLKRALLSVPPAKTGDRLRYEPVAGSYQQLMDGLTKGQPWVWPREPCVKQMSWAARLEQLGEEARIAPAALAMWTDRARAITVQQTIIKLSEATARRLISTPVPAECRAFDFSLGGREQHHALRAEDLRHGDRTSERVQVLDIRDGDIVTGTVTFLHRRGGYFVLLTLAPISGPIDVPACDAVIEQARDRAEAVLNQ